MMVFAGICKKPLTGHARTLTDDSLARAVERGDRHALVNAINNGKASIRSSTRP